MRTIDLHFNQDEEFLHPLWLGIVFLVCVVAIVGTICCLRIKCGSRLCDLWSRFFRRNIETDDNTSNDGKSFSNNYSYNCPSIYPPSPKLYTLVTKLRRAQLEKQQAIRQSSNDDEVDYFSPISISPSPDSLRNSEIARKFYASMRNTTQFRNSPSVDSFNINETTISNHTPSPNRDQRMESNRENQMKLFRTPRFFQSIPHQDRLVITL